ncbi:hypothetical protein STEG23_036942 [Scotinomys teguina]
MCRLSWFLDPGGWGKAAVVGLYFIFPGICTLSLWKLVLWCRGHVYVDKIAGQGIDRLKVKEEREKTNVSSLLEKAAETEAGILKRCLTRVYNPESKGRFWKLSDIQAHIDFVASNSRDLLVYNFPQGRSKATLSLHWLGWFQTTGPVPYLQSKQRPGDS